MSDKPAAIPDEICDDIVDLLRRVQQLQAERDKYKEALENLVEAIEDADEIFNLDDESVGIEMDKDCDAVDKAREALGK